MYCNLIENGLRKRKLPIGELKNAIEDFTPSYPIENIFAYGTLMKGEARHPTLSESSIGEGRLATTDGLLIDLDDYPGMLTGEKGTVYGEVYQIDQMYPTLRTLDTIEGFYGYQSTGSLFTRTIVQIKTEQGRELSLIHI